MSEFSMMEPGFSPKSSPQRAGHMAVGGDQSSLKMKLQLPTPTKPQPFYLMKPESITPSEVTGATNLMASKNLEHSFAKLASKKMKDSLSSFLPHLPGIVDTPGSQDNSSLRGLIEKPPVGGKELNPLNQFQLTGFRLHPGPLPEQYRALLNQVQARERKKAKKRKHKSWDTPAQEDGKSEDDRDKRREKKHKKHDREKKKKEKKKKRSKEEKDM